MEKVCKHEQHDFDFFVEVCLCVIAAATALVQHWFGGLISCLFISHFDVRDYFNYISPTHTRAHTHTQARSRLHKICTIYEYIQYTLSIWSDSIFHIEYHCFNLCNLFARCLFLVCLIFHFYSYLKSSTSSVWASCLMPSILYFCCSRLFSFLF